MLTDNFDPVTGGPLFDEAETLHWLTLTGGVRDIKQANRRQIRAWIRAAAQDDDDSKMKMWSEHLEFCYAPALLRASRIYVH